MDRPRTRPPPGLLAQLTGLLTELDEFLRSSSHIRTHLADFLASRGRPHPGYDACLMIDEVSFTAAELRELTSSPGSRATQTAAQTDHHGHDGQPVL